MSQKMTQKDAVFNAVTAVLSEAGIEVPEGEAFSNHITKEHRSAITNILVEGFNSGTVELDKTYETEAKLRTYCSGLTSNWLRKDRRMNGDVAYVAKNPGSRVGAGDAQLKALRALLSTKTDDSDRAEIQSFIDARVAELGAAKVKKVEVNYDALPAELREKFAPASE